MKQKYVIFIEWLNVLKIIIERFENEFIVQINFVRFENCIRFSTRIFWNSVFFRHCCRCMRCFWCNVINDNLMKRWTMQKKKICNWNLKWDDFLRKKFNKWNKQLFCDISRHDDDNFKINKQTFYKNNDHDNSKTFLTILTQTCYNNRYLNNTIIHMMIYNVTTNNYSIMFVKWNCCYNNVFFFFNMSKKTFTCFIFDVCRLSTCDVKIFFEIDRVFEQMLIK